MTKDYLWAIKDDELFVKNVSDDVNYFHQHWFADKGWPTSGHMFDNIARGSVELWKTPGGNWDIKVMTYTGAGQDPVALGEAIAHEFGRKYKIERKSFRMYSTDITKERDQKFEELATAQRNEPEDAMLRCQHHTLAGGLWSYALEHIGDLTHRMSERFSSFEGQPNCVKGKIDSVLRAMRNPYGYERECNENWKNNYRYYQERHPEQLQGKSFETLLEELKQLGREYSQAHEQLTVYNEAQKLARDAAIALGYQQFSIAQDKLEQLEAHLNMGAQHWKEFAGEYTPGKTASLYHDAKGKTVGDVYLLHFNIPPGTVVPPQRDDATQPFHARHYCGWAEDVNTRIQQHRDGNGARLIQVLKQKGYDFDLVRVWKNVTRDFERQLKDSGGLSRYCPVCKQLGLDRDSVYQKKLAPVMASLETAKTGPLDAVVWRTGPLKDWAGRGIYFGGDQQDCQAYKDLHNGEEAKPYRVQAQNAYVAESQFTLCKELLGKNWGDEVYRVDCEEFGARNSMAAARTIEARMMSILKKKGYDALVYTKPQPPAKTEFVALKPSVKIEEVQPEQVTAAAKPRVDTAALAHEYVRIHNDASLEYKQAFKEIGARMWQFDNCHKLHPKNEAFIADDWKSKPLDYVAQRGLFLPLPLTVMDSYPEARKHRPQLEKRIHEIHDRYTKELATIFEKALGKEMMDKARQDWAKRIGKERINEDGYWAGEGNAASGILPICSKTGKIGLAWRSEHVNHGNCWGTIGGAVKKDMSPAESAEEELGEEAGYYGPMQLIPAFVFTDGEFKYHNFLGVVPEEFDLNPDAGRSAGVAHADENTDIAWFTYQEWIKAMREIPGDFHPGVIALFQNSAEEISALTSPKQEGEEKSAAFIDPAKISFRTQGKPPRSIRVVMEYDGEFIGKLDFRIDDYEENAVFVEDSYVVPRLLNHGLGNKMYDAAIEAAREKGFRIFMQGTPQSPEAKRVWNSMKKRHNVQYDQTFGYYIPLQEAPPDRGKRRLEKLEARIHPKTAMGINKAKWMKGGCWALAYALWQRLSGEKKFVGEWAGTPFNAFVHAAVQTADGTVWDVNGPQTEEQFMERCRQCDPQWESEFRVMPNSEIMLKLPFSDHYDDADAVANELIKRHKTAACQEDGPYLIWMIWKGKLYMDYQAEAWSHDSWMEDLDIPQKDYDRITRGYVQIEPDDKKVTIMTYCQEFAPEEVVRAVKSKFPYTKKFQFRDKRLGQLRVSTTKSEESAG